MLGSSGPTRAAEPTLRQVDWTGWRLKGQVPPELQTRPARGRRKRQDPPSAAKLKEDEAGLDPKNPLSPYRRARPAATSSNGHKSSASGPTSPASAALHRPGRGRRRRPASLDGVGARQNREYLLESLVAPNAKIAPGFESVIVKTNEDKYRVGVVKKDDDKELVLLNPDPSRTSR